MTDEGLSHPGQGRIQSYNAWTGRVVDGRYRVESLLGEGGMGAVFKAEHIKLGKTVALKVIHPEFAGDGEMAERFVREAMAAAQLEHPHVATATDYGTLTEGGAYLVMQFVEGESLRTLLDREGTLSWKRSAEIIAQVADALSTAHKRGIVHRDLKPDNIMLQPSDDGSLHVKVLDFGIARVATDAKGGALGKPLTQMGTVIGTPGYMAPEQALGEPIDHRVDIYALGLLLYEMVTGTRVLDNHDLTAMVTRQLTEPIPPLASVASVPTGLDQLVGSMLQVEREDRPENAAVVRERLRELVLEAKLEAVTSGGQPTEPKPQPKPGLSALADTAPAGRRAPRPKTAETTAGAPTIPIHGPSPWLVKLVIAGLIAAVLTGVGVYWALDRADHPTATSSEPAPSEPSAPLTVPAEPATAEPAPEPRAPEPVPATAAAAPAATIPRSIADAFADLNLSEDEQTRHRASAAVLDHEPRAEVPEVVLQLAELERATRCTARRRRIEALAELGSPQALPALERLDATPRDTCRRGRDCHACLRDALSSALETLRSRLE